MSTLEDAEFITEAAASLGGPLHEALDRGDERTRSHFREFNMTGPEYARERTELTRAHARQYLGHNLLGDWTLTNEAPTGTLWVRRGLLSVRVLHIAPDGMIPAPGRNRARVNYYLNPGLQLFGAEASQLLALWAKDPDSGSIDVRVVRPVGRWAYGKNAKVDIDFMLPRDDFGALEFIPDDEGINVPLFLDGETGQEGASGVTGW